MRRTLLLFALAASAAPFLPAQMPEWDDRTDNLTTIPSMRRGGAMAFDATANRLILYGGVAVTPAMILSDTWAYNGTAWSKLNPAGGALPRWGHRLVRDTAQNRLITFGGRSPSLSGLANDTYAWTGTAWTVVPSPTAPPARFRYGLAYDSLRDRVVLFGGRGVDTVFDDTWEFDGVAWTQVETTTQPSPREDMVMAYDSGLNRTVVFGGYDPATDTVFGDTWEWNGTKWQEREIAAGPGPRFRAAGVFDSVRNRIVIYGGFSGEDITDETWEYVGGTWTGIPVSSTVQATEMHSGYDSQRRRFVTFGGTGSVFSTETWEYIGVNTGVLGTFGEGCPTSVGIAFPTAAQPPRINTTYTIKWENLPVTAPAVIVAHGVSNASWSGLPLPFELSILGLNNCHLLVSADLTAVAPVVAGEATTSLAIPNTASFVNTSIYSQILVPDAQAPNGNGGASIGARSLIGP